MFGEGLGCLGMVGMFGEGLGMLEDVWVGDIWRSGNCCGSSHMDLDGNIPPPTLFKIRREYCSGAKIMNRERESHRCCRRQKVWGLCEVVQKSEEEEEDDDD